MYDPREVHLSFGGKAHAVLGWECMESRIRQIAQAIEGNAFAFRGEQKEELKRKKRYRQNWEHE